MKWKKNPPHYAKTEKTSPFGAATTIMHSDKVTFYWPRVAGEPHPFLYSDDRLANASVGIMPEWASKRYFSASFLRLDLALFFNIFSAMVQIFSLLLVYNLWLLQRIMKKTTSVKITVFDGKERKGSGVIQEVNTTVK